MPQPLKLLLIEDSADDAELIVRELRRAGFEVDWRRVQTEADFLASLDDELDLIISDFAMPEFDGLRALDLLTQRGRDLPFIIVSGTIGEETAVVAMQQGASDYLLKDRLARLGVAVERALGTARLRRERGEAEALRAENIASMTAAQQIGNFGSWELELSNPDLDRNRLTWSDQCFRIFGLEPASVAVTNELFFSLVHPDDRAAIKTVVTAAVERRGNYFIEHRVVRGDGKVRQVRESGRVFSDPATSRPTKIIGTIHDVTEQKLAETAMREQRAFFEALASTSVSGIIVVDAHGRKRFQNRRAIELLKIPAEIVANPDHHVQLKWAAVQTKDPAGFTARVTELSGRRDGTSCDEIELNDGTVLARYSTPVLAADGEYQGRVATLFDVTERKRLEAALRESERFLRAALDSLTAHIAILDERGTILAVNAAWRQFSVVNGLDWERGGEGRNYLDVCDRVRGTPVAEAQPVAGAIREILAGDRAFYEAEYACHSPTEERWFMVRITPFPGAGPRRVVVAHENITRRRVQEEALRVSEERFRQVVENSEEVFWMAAADEDRLLYLSPRFEAIWGRPLAERFASSQAWVESIHPDDRDRVVQAANKQKTGGYDETYRIVRPDGSVRWVHARAFPVKDADGVVRRVVGVAADVTTARELEQKFLRAQRLEAVGTLAGGIAHDLNNILAPMLMIGPILRGSLAAQRDMDLLVLVERSAQRGANIIKQLLTFSRGIEGKRGPVQLRHLVEEMCSLMEETFPREIAISQDVAPGLHAVTVDVTQLHQLLMNLCVNARDAMPQGGRLELRARNLSLTEAERDLSADMKPGAYVELTVADSGQGISPEVIGRIFEPFFTTKEIGRGTGLGLSTVLGIVRSHGGFVIVNSEPGKGTQFRVFFPAELDPVAVPVVGERGLKPSGNNELILVVDDERPIREVTERLLVQHHYTVLCAADGQEALVTFLLHRSRIRLLITDLMMPVMGGVELIGAVLTLEPKLPVIATTGLKDPERIQELAELGVHHVLSKPCESREVLDAVNAALHPVA